MNKRPLVIPLLILIFFLFIYSNCNQKKHFSRPKGKIVVTVSVPPQAYFVERIGGKFVEVHIMVPKSESPVTYEPTIRQLAKIRESSIYLKVGSPNFSFEIQYLPKILSSNQQLQIINMSEGLQIRPFDSDHDHEASGEGNHHANHLHKGLDPHVWVSPANVKICSENIYKVLSQLDPKHKDYYQLNLKGFLKDIHQLDKAIRQSLSHLRSKTFIVYHPAWGYFAREYGLKQVSIEAEGKEPSLQDLKRLIDMAKKNRTKVLFVQKGFSKESAQKIADEIGAQVLEINPLEKDWLDNLKKVSQTFKRALE
ncbi:MAG TPA: zinc ABC transporter substrate-binding protein [Spirochaetes bacterium]|nr:zinc ABC transporter substrate-binding protein [Spirochaetota bacterium]